MCMADSPFETGFKAGPNYCPKHPDFDMGHQMLSPFGFYRYSRRCEHCIVAVIAAIPTDEYLKEFSPDPKTIQLVLDVLEQKLGLN